MVEELKKIRGNNKYTWAINKTNLEYIENT